MNLYGLVGVTHSVLSRWHTSTWYEERMPVVSLLSLRHAPGFHVNHNPEEEPRNTLKLQRHIIYNTFSRIINTDIKYHLGLGSDSRKLTKNERSV